MPLALATLLSFALSPVVRALQKFGSPRALGAVVALAMFMAAIGVWVWFVSGQVTDLANKLPAYQPQHPREGARARRAFRRRRGSGGFARLGERRSKDVAPAAPADGKRRSGSSSSTIRRWRASARRRLSPRRCCRRSAQFAHRAGVHRLPAGPAGGLAQPADQADRRRRTSIARPRRSTTPAAASAACCSRRCVLNGDVRAHHRAGAVGDRRAEPGAVGRDRRHRALRALYRRAARRRCRRCSSPSPSIPAGRSFLLTLGLFAVAEGVTGQLIEPIVYGHSVPGFRRRRWWLRRRCWAFLWGADRPGAGDAADDLPRRARPPRAGAGLPGDAARRRAAAHRAGNLLPAHAGGRSARGGFAGAALSQARRHRRILRRGRAGGACGAPASTSRAAISTTGGSTR